MRVSNYEFELAIMISSVESTKRGLTLGCVVSVLMIAAVILVSDVRNPARSGLPVEVAKSYIVQTDSLERAVKLVEASGGQSDRAFPIINGVQAYLTDAALKVLQERHPGIRVTRDLQVEVAGKRPSKQMAYTMESSTSEKESTTEATAQVTLDYAHAPSLINANALHHSGIDGRGVTIAMVDSGMTADYYIGDEVDPGSRPVTFYDAIAATGRISRKLGDDHGHGTHVLSILGSSYPTADNYYEGVAPGAGVLALTLTRSDPVMLTKIDPLLLCS